MAESLVTVCLLEGHIIIIEGAGCCKTTTVLDEAESKEYIAANHIPKE